MDNLKHLESIFYNNVWVYKCAFFTFWLLVTNLGIYMCTHSRKSIGHILCARGEQNILVFVDHVVLWTENRDLEIKLTFKSQATIDV